MSQGPMWRRYLRFLGTDIRADVDDELRSHLEMRTEELIEEGMSPEAARVEALRHFHEVREPGDAVDLHLSSLVRRGRGTPTY